MSKKINSALFSSILYIIIGLLLVIFRSETIGWAMTISAIFFITSGVLEVIKNNYVGGAISLIIGITVLVLGWAAATIVLLVLGILIAIKGVATLLDALKAKKPNALDIVYPALTIITGLSLAFGNGLDIIIIITGILLALDGVLGLVGSLKK